MDPKGRLADELGGARARTLALLAPLDDTDLRRQHSPIMSPLVWDLAHVGNYEEQWLVRAISGGPPIDDGLDDIYDAFRHPRPNRPALPLLGPVEARTYLGDVRSRTLEVLDHADLEDNDRLLRNGFVYRMVLQHEHQHDETMLATLQLMEGPGYRPTELRNDQSPAVVGSSVSPSDDVAIEGGSYVVGSNTDPWAYDNEHPAHAVELAPFRLDRFPVTNGRFLEFMADGGYEQSRWWDHQGWQWKETEAATSPMFWTPEGGGSWSRLRFGRREDIPLDEPVQHVSWYEADAYCRWAGGRLPTETEWEVAASATSHGSRRRLPWGDASATPERANLAHPSDAGRRFGPSPIGGCPQGVSALGIEQLIGDVWEWTSSDFEPYPGFGSFPYREYSEVFFGSRYRVLRGGSWATHPLAVRNTFRNWDLPVRRQIFSGFRCARSA